MNYSNGSFTKKLLDDFPKSYGRFLKFLAKKLWTIFKKLWTKLLKAMDDFAKSYGRFCKKL